MVTRYTRLVTVRDHVVVAVRHQARLHLLADGQAPRRRRAEGVLEGALLEHDVVEGREHGHRELRDVDGGENGTNMAARRGISKKFGCYC